MLRLAGHAQVGPRQALTLALRSAEMESSSLFTSPGLTTVTTTIFSMEMAAANVVTLKLVSPAQAALPQPLMFAKRSVVMDSTLAMSSVTITTMSQETDAAAPATLKITGSAMEAHLQHLMSALTTAEMDLLYQECLLHIVTMVTQTTGMDAATLAKYS